jgi:hypothetical protein
VILRAVSNGKEAYGVTELSHIPAELVTNCITSNMDD